MGPGPLATEDAFCEQFIEGFADPDPGVALFTVIDETETTKSKAGQLAGMLIYINTSPVNRQTEIGNINIFYRFSEHTSRQTQSDYWLNMLLIRQRRVV